jgi:hypothetical protein
MLLSPTSPTSPTAAAARTSITVRPVPVAVIGSRVDLASTHRLMSVVSSRLPRELLVILVGMPLAATVLGWLLGGRDPAGISRQPLE